MKENQEQLGIQVTDLKSLGIAVVHQDPATLNHLFTKGFQEALVMAGWERLADGSLVKPFPFDATLQDRGQSADGRPATCLTSAALGVFHVVARIDVKAKAQPPNSVLMRLPVLGAVQTYTCLEMLWGLVNRPALTGD